LSRIVVTGGGGFVGSHVCEALLQRGDQVVAVDNFCTSRRDNVDHLLDRSGFELVVADVSEELPVAGRIDGVLHLACPASPPEYLSMPLETLTVCSIGTRRALDLARVHEARFLLASTSEVYGDPLVHPQSEGYHGNVDPIGPRAVYDEAKRFAETLTMTYNRLYDVPTRIVRIFNTYGPRLRPADGRVVSNFLVQAIDGKPLTVYGNGTQTRSFCYVDDEVRGILALFDSDIVEPVNIGNPTEFTMLALAALVCEVAGSTAELVFEPLPEGDPTRRRPDITRARRLLKWEPAVELREGLERTHAWYLEERTHGRP
jgi:dTDP-glucose 4,6-dehydratase